MAPIMHQCAYCSEQFFSQYSLMGHMKVHNKKAELTSTGIAFPGFPPPSIIPSPSSQPSSLADLCWPQNSWQWGSSSTNTTGVSPFHHTTDAKDSMVSRRVGNTVRTQGQGHVDDETSSSSGCGNSDFEIPQRNPKGNRKLYECQTCSKVFRSYPGLRYHRNSQHTQDGPYKCEYCDKRFCQKSHLSRHETIHTGEKQYVCSYCDKTFRIKGNLQIHLRIHTGEKPYACESCGKRFTQQQSAKAHAKLHSKYK